VPSLGLDGLPSPLAPGARISNLRGVLNPAPVEPRPSGLGRLGFFALANGTRRREVVLVSSRHVLLAHGAGRRDPVYRPVFASHGETSVIRGDALEPVAEIVDEGAEANHRFAYDGEPLADYFVDCATARLLGATAYTASTIRGVARLHPLDVVGRRAPRVRVLAGPTCATEGRVVDVNAAVEGVGGCRLGNIVIRCSGEAVEPGDSGALLVDERDFAVGLLWGRSDRDPEVAYACHIHPVLDRLGVTMLTRA
jgi:hypothetical protein